MTEKEIAPAQADATPEQVQQEKDEAYESGFNEVRGIKTPAKPAEAKAEIPESTPEPKPAKETKEEVKEEIKDEDRPSAIPGYTEKQLKALLSKGPEVETKMASEVSKLHGKIGELTRLIKQIQTAKPTQEGRKITASALKRIASDYGQDLAEALAEDLSTVYSDPQEKQEAPKTEAPNYNAELEARFNARLNEEKIRLQAEFQEEMLTLRHKDWRAILPTEEFKSWWYSLPEDKRKYYDSPKAERSAEALDAYKSERDKAKQKTVKKQERLEAVITPKTSAPTTPTLTDDDALEAGFRSVRRRRL